MRLRGRRGGEAIIEAGVLCTWLTHCSVSCPDYPGRRLSLTHVTSIHVLDRRGETHRGCLNLCVGGRGHLTPVVRWSGGCC